MSRSYQAGQFNTKVQIEKLDAGQDSLGAPARTWSLHAEWWCRIAPVTGSEAFGEGQVTARADVRLEGGYVDGVTAAMRVNDHGRFYDLTAQPLIFTDRSVRYMTLLAKTGVNNG